MDFDDYGLYDDEPENSYKKPGKFEEKDEEELEPNLHSQMPQDASESISVLEIDGIDTSSTQFNLKDSLKNQEVLNGSSSVLANSLQNSITSKKKKKKMKKRKSQSPGEEEKSHSMQKEEEVDNSVSNIILGLIKEEKLEKNQEELGINSFKGNQSSQFRTNSKNDEAEDEGSFRKEESGHKPKKERKETEPSDHGLFGHISGGSLDDIDPNDLSDESFIQNSIHNCQDDPESEQFHDPSSNIGMEMNISSIEENEEEDPELHTIVSNINGSSILPYSSFKLPEKVLSGIIEALYDRKSRKKKYREKLRRELLTPFFKDNIGFLHDVNFEATFTEDLGATRFSPELVYITVKNKMFLKMDESLKKSPLDIIQHVSSELFSFFIEIQRRKIVEFDYITLINFNRTKHSDIPQLKTKTPFFMAEGIKVKFKKFIFPFVLFIGTQDCNRSLKNNEESNESKRFSFYNNIRECSPLLSWLIPNCFVFLRHFSDQMGFMQIPGFHHHVLFTIFLFYLEVEKKGLRNSEFFSCDKPVDKATFDAVSGFTKWFIGYMRSPKRRRLDLIARKYIELRERDLEGFLCFVTMLKEDPFVSVLDPLNRNCDMFRSLHRRAGGAQKYFYHLVNAFEALQSIFQNNKYEEIFVMPKNLLFSRNGKNRNEETFRPAPEPARSPIPNTRGPNGIWGSNSGETSLQTMPSQATSNSNRESSYQSRPSQGTSNSNSYGGGRRGDYQGKNSSQSSRNFQGRGGQRNGGGRGRPRTQRTNDHRYYQGSDGQSSQGSRHQTVFFEEWI